jgi:hypothetical protein
MSEPRNYHDIPNPDGVAAGRNNREGTGEQTLANQARRYKPDGAPSDETPVSTLSRFSSRLLNRVTGEAKSLDEITPAAIGAETPAGAAAQIEAAALTPAQIMSKAGEQLIASLQVTRPANAGTAHFATTRATSGTFLVRTSTGYARLINADGTLGTQAGTGAAGNNITLTIPASGLHRALGVLSVANGGSVRSGDITVLHLYSHQLTTFSGTGLSSLTELSANDNLLTSFDGTGLSSLTSLVIYNNQLTTFSGTGLSSLTYLDLYNNQLTTFSGTGLSSLTTLYLNSNQLTTFSSTGLSSLTSLQLNSNQLTSFDGTGLSSVNELNLQSNQLTSFDGTGLSSLTSLDLSDNQLGPVDVSGLANLETVYVTNNLMSAAALDAFYTSLETSPGVLTYWQYPGIYVTGNSGTAGDDPSIATAKGHTVYGS